MKDGYVLVVKAPKGMKVKKGDIVAFYANVGAKKGKHDLRLVRPAYVRVAPGARTAWYLGTKVR